MTIENRPDLDEYTPEPDFVIAAEEYEPAPRRAAPTIPPTRRTRPALPSSWPLPTDDEDPTGPGPRLKPTNDGRVTVRGDDEEIRRLERCRPMVG